MKFDIKCATFARIASICSFFEPRTLPDIRAKLNTVRLETRNGRTFAVATNQQVAAIELIGITPGAQDGHAHIILDPVLINQCKAEAFMNGVLSINVIPEIATAFAQTSSGWNYPGNPCYWFDDTPLNDWRNWAPDAPVTKTENIMMWSVFHMQSLVETSPSGKVYFPKHVDAEKPVVIRDCVDPNWVGLFVPKPQGETQKIAATLPDWWRA